VLGLSGPVRQQYEFPLASEFAKRFCPRDKPLFTLRKTNSASGTHVYFGSRSVISGLDHYFADGDTAGAAEAVAGVIRIYDKALIIGQQTAGQAVEYSDLKLPSGKVLRVAVGEVVLPAVHPLFPGGLKPDVPVEMAGSRLSAKYFKPAARKG